MWSPPGARRTPPPSPTSPRWSVWPSACCCWASRSPGTSRSAPRSSCSGSPSTRVACACRRAARGPSPSRPRRMRRAYECAPARTRKSPCAYPEHHRNRGRPMPNRLLRWLPAVVAPVAVAAVAVAVPFSAGAAASLPDKSPQQVLELVAKSAAIPGFSGTVQQRSDLGLPQLPAGIGARSDADASSANAVELLTGTHTVKVFESGKDERRVQVLDAMAERDVVRNGEDVWFWDAKHNTATHVTVPQRSTPDGTDVLTPADAAKRALDSIDGSTVVAVDGSASIAGRDAYQLVLTPKSSGTTVGSVNIAVDSETGLPLQVQVTARGGTSPAFSVGFTELDLTKPADSTFDFQPPSGATVHQEAVPRPSSSSDHPKPTVTGSGWDAVVTLDAGASATADITKSGVFQQLTKAVNGGRVLSTTLVNVLVTDDGHVLAGAVPVSRLEAVAAG